MAKKYAQGFIIPRFFLSNYDGGSEMMRGIDGLVTIDGSIISVVGVGLDHPVMATIDYQDLAAMVNFAVTKFSDQEFSSLKGAIDTEAARRGGSTEC